MVTALHENTPFCLERLEERIKSINGGTITASESRRLLVEMVGCFIVVGRQVGRIKHSVELLDKQSCSHSLTEKGDMMRREEDQDTMRRIVKWFVDSVLPTLLSTAIIGAILWFSAVNGLISVTP